MNNSTNPKIQAVDKSVAIYSQIREACERPDKSIVGESLKIYKELDDWGLLDKYPITNLDFKHFYVTIIAMYFMKNEKKTDKLELESRTKWEMIQAALRKAKK